MNNVAPTDTLSGPVSAIVNQELTFTISATDPSPADEAAGFLYTKHFDPRFLARKLLGRDPAGVTTTLSFPWAGTFVVTFTATDDDGGTTTVTQTVVVSAPTPAGLQHVVDEIISSVAEPVVAVATTTETELDAMITAIEGITVDLDPEDPPIVLVLNLSGGDYAGKEISVPEDVIVTIENGMLTGASPALIVSGGIMIAENVTFTNSTSAPTILVTGGSLQVRGSLIHETDGGDKAAIEITGGTVDLGTIGDVGGNTVIIHGARLAFRNLSTNPVKALGNTFEIDGNALTSGCQIEDVVDHALDNSGVGLVIWESGAVYVTPGSGSVQRGVDAVAENGRVNVQGRFDKDYDAAGKLLTVAYQDGATLIAQLNPFDTTVRELVVIGTEGRDKIEIKAGDVDGAIEVKIKEKGRGKFKVRNEHGPVIDRVVVYGLGDDDNIKVHSKAGAISTELYGGPGNDKLRGDEGDDYLWGGPGDDVLSGKHGRDVMIGGLGKDKIDGDDGDDILIGGVYLDSENRANVHALMSEWTRTDLAYAARVDHLLNGGGLNGSVVLNATTVFDDDTKDKLKGKPLRAADDSSNPDWRFGQR